MKYSLKLSLVLISLFSLVFGISVPSLQAATTNSAQFNPHFIISDEEMQNYQGMTEGDIQAFLDDHKGYIARLQVEDKNGVTKPTARIIYEAAQEYRINPKYILVKLQKEQSLVTDNDPTQKQIDWATGYGVCDSCSMDDPKIQKYKGFGKQVDYAAGIIRWYYDNVGSQSWIKRANVTYAIDNQSVTPVNMATAFLYTYTPHILGNQNFWKLWQKWFDQVFPDGTLVKSTANNTVYLIQDGKKRPFKSMAALASRYNPKLIINAPETELVRYQTLQPISLPNYSILKQGENYYLLDYDTLRPFASAEVVKKLGYNPDEIINVTSDELTGLTTGNVITLETTAPIGELVRIKENKSLYFIKDGVYHPVMHNAIAKSRFPQHTEVTKEISYLQKFTMGDPILFPDGTMMKVKGFPEVFIIEHGEKRHITYEAFVGWGLSFSNMVEVDEITGIYHPTGQSIFLRDGMVTKPTSSTKPATSAPSTPAKPVTPAPSKMVEVSAADTKFEGKIFETPVNTYLVAEYGTNKVLAAKNADFARPLASFTKVMTGYRLMVEGLSFSKSVTYNAKEHKAIYHTFRIAEGEKVLNRDLFTAMLVSSINTASRMVVDSVAKDESLFVKRMNEQAQQLGLTKTKFVDVTGESEKNVATAKEYLTLFNKAINNVEVKNTLGMKGYEYNEIVDTDGKPRHYDDHSNALALKKGLPFTVLASKTGYLEEAGTNLVMLVERNSDKKKFIIITMGNPDYNNRFVEPEKLTRWALENF